MDDAEAARRVRAFTLARARLYGERGVDAKRTVIPDLDEWERAAEAILADPGEWDGVEIEIGREVQGGVMGGINGHAIGAAVAPPAETGHCPRHGTYRISKYVKVCTKCRGENIAKAKAAKRAESAPSEFIVRNPEWDAAPDPPPVVVRPNPAPAACAADAPAAPARPDMVDRPPHYNAGPVECIDAIAAALGPEGFAAFLRGQVLKYIWRGPHKGAEAQDYRKARFYLDRLVRHTGGDDAPA